MDTEIGMQGVYILYLRLQNYNLKGGLQSKPFQRKKPTKCIPSKSIVYQKNENQKARDYNIIYLSGILERI